MAVSIGAGLSTHADARVGAIEAGQAAARGLGGARADLALVFAAGRHLAAPEATLEGVDEALAPAAHGRLRRGRRARRRPRDRGGHGGRRVGRLARAAPTIETFRERRGARRRSSSCTACPTWRARRRPILLPDPYTFPTEAALAALAADASRRPGRSAAWRARAPRRAPRRFPGRRAVEGGAVGVRLAGVEVLPCVSQGAAPVGPELTITAAEGNVIAELAGRRRWTPCAT